MPAEGGNFFHEKAIGNALHQVKASTIEPLKDLPRVKEGVSSNRRESVGTSSALSLESVSDQQNNNRRFTTNPFLTCEVVTGGKGAGTSTDAYWSYSSNENNNIPKNKNTNVIFNSPTSDVVVRPEMASKLNTSHNCGTKASMANNVSAPNTPEPFRRSHLHRSGNRSSEKKEKMEFNQMVRLNYVEGSRPLSYHGKANDFYSSHITTNKTKALISNKSRQQQQRRSMSFIGENKSRDKFDVSQLDTNLPKIDLEAIENHLQYAKEEEKKRRNEREEIRRRLALDSEDLNSEKTGRKTNLHSRLHSSMNLQICFMNETASDSDSPNSDTESGKCASQQDQTSVTCQKAPGLSPKVNFSYYKVDLPNEEFHIVQEKLQAEARNALTNAKELARIQMAQSRDGSSSPITELLRNSLLKVGATLPSDRRRVSRQLLTEMNVAQLQVVVNDLHSHIEDLNDKLVKMLLERDDLHMEQDSMLVDIEDLTRYLAAKQNPPRHHQSLPLLPSSSRNRRN